MASNFACCGLIPNSKPKDFADLLSSSHREHWLPKFQKYLKYKDTEDEKTSLSTLLDLYLLLLDLHKNQSVSTQELVQIREDYSGKTVALSSWNQMAFDENTLTKEAAKDIADKLYDDCLLELERYFGPFLGDSKR